MTIANNGNGNGNTTGNSISNITANLLLATTDTNATATLTASPTTTTTPSQLLTQATATHSKTLQQATKKYRNDAQAELEHFHYKRRSLEKFSNPNFITKSVRYQLKLHPARDISPLLETRFKSIETQAEATLEKAKRDLSRIVKEHLATYVENITHTRIKTLYKHCKKLLHLHLVSSLHAQDPPSTILKDENTSAQTLYCALQLVTQRLDENYIRYLMGNPNATAAQTENFKETTLFPLFTALYGHNQPPEDSGPNEEDVTLIMVAVDTLMAYLPLATVLHAAHQAKRKDAIEIAAKEKAILSATETRAATTATAQALATEDTPKDMKTLEEVLKNERHQNKLREEKMQRQIDDIYNSIKAVPPPRKKAATPPEAAATRGTKRTPSGNNTSTHGPSHKRAKHVSFSAKNCRAPAATSTGRGPNNRSNNRDQNNRGPNNRGPNSRDHNRDPNRETNHSNNSNRNPNQRRNHSNNGGRGRGRGRGDHSNGGGRNNRRS